MPKNVEKLILQDLAVHGIGNNLGNTLSANNNKVSVLEGKAGNDTYIIHHLGDVVIETSTSTKEIDEIRSNVNYTLPSHVENLALMLSAVQGRGNALDNVLTGNENKGSWLFGFAGNDELHSINGANLLVGGKGKDHYYLSNNLGRDTVRIHQEDSLTSSFDVIRAFGQDDRLNLDSNHIAANVASVNGKDFGAIKSHHISQGLISFDNIDNYTTPLTITASKITNVVKYLQTNITHAGDTVAFAVDGDSYVFQDNGTEDTLVQLVGVTLNGISHTPVAGLLHLI